MPSPPVTPARTERAGHGASADHVPADHVPAHVNDNIATLGEVAAEEMDRVGAHQRGIEAVTSALARPITIYLLLAAGAGWVIYNVIAPAHGWPQVDHPPAFPLLEGVVTFFAACVTVCVLIVQRRVRRDAERRAKLEFHVNLLSEQKATKIIALLEELRRDLPNVRNRHDAVAEAMQEEVDPKAVHSLLAERP